jgi:(2Fe-2S) ferredoxin
VVVGRVFYARVFQNDMKIIVLKRILKGIGVDKKNKERYEKEIK